MTLPNINSTLKNVALNLSQVISATNALGTTLGTTIAVIRANLTTLNTEVAALSASVASMGMVYLGSISVSGGALSDTTILAASNASYRSFELIFKNIIGTVIDDNYLVRWHSGTAFQSAAYSSTIVFLSSGGSVIGNRTSTTGIVIGFADTGSVPGASGVITVSGLAGTSNKIAVNRCGCSDNGLFYQVSSSGVWNSTAVINGFQIVDELGNSLSSGSVDIYGIL